MSMLKRAAVAAALGLLATAPAWSQPGHVSAVVFLEDAGQHVALKGAAAKAYDRADKPLFEAGIDYIRDYAENPTGRVHVWDPISQRVRLSAEGKDEVWLRCADVAPMSIACGPRLGIQGAVIFVGEGAIPPRWQPAPPDPGGGPFGSINHGSGTGQGSGYAAGPGLGRGVPFCPGDPRCRKVKTARP